MNLQKNISSVKRIAKVILFLNCLNSFANQGLIVAKTMFQWRIIRQDRSLIPKRNWKWIPKPMFLLWWKNPYLVMSAVIFETHFSRTMRSIHKILNKTNTLAGITIDKTCLETLFPGHWLDDQVINGFFTLLPQKARLMRLLTFDIFFAHRLLTRNLMGYHNWADYVKVWTYDVWFIPINFQHHWTLLVVIFRHNFLLYLDSMHGQPPAQFLNRLCDFINYHTVSTNNSLKWREWKVHAPKDVPFQVSRDGNCGVHVCIWAYIICTSSYTMFDDNDITEARKRIAKLLLHSKVTQSDDVCKSRHLLLSGNDKMTKKSSLQHRFQISRTPPAGSDSTLEYCASLAQILAATLQSIRACKTSGKTIIFYT